MLKRLEAAIRSTQLQLNMLRIYKAKGDWEAFDHNTFCLAYKENFEPTEINFSSFRFFINDYNCAGC